MLKCGRDHVYVRGQVRRTGSFWTGVRACGMFIPICIDPPVSAQVRPLKHRLERVFSYPAPGVGVGCYKTGPSLRSPAWRAAAIQSDVDECIALSGNGSVAPPCRSVAGSVG